MKKQYIYLGYNIEMGQYPVTFDEYIEFCNATGRNIPYDNGYGKGSRPVINVCWNDAVEYCNWLSAAAGLEPAYYLDDEMWFLKGEPDELEGFRIPESYEWEYAARGGEDHTATRFAGSNDLDEVAWYYDNANWTTKPVGLKKGNGLGLYDMSGNVWEWLNCGGIKGGSYNDGDYNLFEVNYISRYYHNRDEGCGNIGFRVVRTLVAR